MDKTLILYVFHKVNDAVLYFIKHGIFKSDIYHFVFICNSLEESLDLVPKYVTIIKRENKGFDFGGWSVGLLENDRYKKYKNFIFVNSTCIGPFVPPYYKDPWCDIFINGLTDDIKLFGSTINCCGHAEDGPQNYSHIQSWIFSTKISTLEFLIEKKIFSVDNFYTDKNLLIKDKEVRMSRIIIDNGWNIGCLMKNYENLDFRNLTNDTHFLSNIDSGDVSIDYVIHPYELIFLKINREVFTRQIPKYFYKVKTVILSITVPPGCVEGQHFPLITPDGRHLKVECPRDVTPGQVVIVEVLSS